MNFPSLRQLRYLVALAERGHFGRAAEACAVTQSTLSAGIQELEEGLGASLVERSKRHVLLTPLGHEIVERARRVLREAQDLAEAAQAGRSPLAGPLRLGVIPTVGPYLLPRLMPRLRRSFPELRLFIREEQTAPLLARLAAGELDVLLLARPYDLGEVETMDLGADEILVACPKSHPFAAADPVGPGRLKREGLLMLEDGHCLRSQALAACRLSGPDANEVFQGTSLRTLLQMVAEGLGVTLVPRMAVDSELPSGGRVVVRPLAPTQSRDIVLAWRRSSAHGAAFRRLGEVVVAAL
jgi:LysR family transcriptional regulator, hydrogen peroxide-inducible genes activator